MSTIGAYSDVDFGDSATHAAIRDMGGWPKLCRTDTKELSYLQHRFCELYKAHDGRGEAVPALMGDRSPNELYLRQGMQPPTPKLIAGGNPSKTKALELQTKITQALGYK
jgi:hypothetical protein